MDRELIQSGNEEHLARVSFTTLTPSSYTATHSTLYSLTHTHTHTHTQAVVLLLCLAVQRKPNEDVISRITTLPYKAQCDIMYFIEEALAKINSNALSSGLFTSGESNGGLLGGVCVFCPD